VNYGRRWQRARLEHLAEHPFCVDCEAEGKCVLGDQVDHNEPHRGDYALFWDRTNWRTRCASHHSRKTAREVAAAASGLAPRGGLRNVS
jgi:5-methylcytosine-specific restriction protein A